MAVRYEIVQSDIISGFAPVRLASTDASLSISEAISRLTSPNDYIVAVEDGRIRELNDAEETTRRTLVGLSAA